MTTGTDRINRGRGRPLTLWTAVAVSIMAAACGGGGGGDDDAATSSSDEQSSSATAGTSMATTLPAVDTEPPTTSSTTTTPTTTTTTVAPFATPADAVPMGDPAHDLIDFQNPYGNEGDVTSTHIAGVVALGPNTDGTVDCYAMIGTRSVTSAAGLAVPGSSFPSIEMTVGEQTYAPQQYGSCSSELLKAAGWFSSFSVAVTPGTTVPFYVLGETDLGVVPEFVALGNEGARLRYYQWSTIDAVPPAPAVVSGPAPTGLISPGTVVPIVGEYDTWDVTVLGTTDTLMYDPAEATTNRCLAVFAAVQPTTVGIGVVANGLDAPHIELLADGIVQGDVSSNCDLDPFDGQYTNAYVSAVTQGTPLMSFQVYEIPASATVQAIVLGASYVTLDGGEEATLIDPIPLAALPDPIPDSAGVSPTLTLTEPGTEFTVIGYDDVAWHFTGAGMWYGQVVGEQQCVAVLARVRTDTHVDQYLPDVGVLASGHLYGSGIGCDFPDLNAAGWSDDVYYDPADSTVSTAIYFPSIIETGTVLNAAVFGNAASADEVTYVNPVVPPAIPTP